MKFRSGELSTDTLRVVPTRRIQVEDRVSVELALLVIDLVGSGQLLATLGDSAYSSFLDRFKDQAHDIVASHRGVAVADTGDGLIAGFETVADAVDAAAGLHAATAAIGDGATRLRSGVHHGWVVVGGYGIVGQALYDVVELGNAAPADHLWVSEAAAAELGGHVVSTGELTPTVLPRSGVALVLDINCEPTHESSPDPMPVEADPEQHRTAEPPAKPGGTVSGGFARSRPGERHRPRWLRRSARQSTA